MANFYLTVTIDVEPDCTPTWHYSNPLTFKSVSIGIKERLQPLFNKYGVVPTYLINNVVMEDEASVNILNNLEGEHELGAHLHPEFIEPEKKYFDYAGKKGDANCCFYEPDIEFEKIKNISELFENKFGYKPSSFRAGRFSAGNNTITSLIKCGYKVDSSVTPHICWNDKTREKPIDFINAPEQTYFIKNNTILEKSVTGSILEVPVTICLIPTNFTKELIFSVVGLRRKIANKKIAWLRPCFSTFTDIIKIIEIETNLGKNKRDVLLNMMFHNVEILPKLSPYTKNENDCNKYLALLEKFFIYINSKSFTSIKLSDAYEIYKK